VDDLEIDASGVRAVSPLAAVRIAMLMGVARVRGCKVEFVEPEDPVARATFDAYSMLEPIDAADLRIDRPVSGVILPCTSLRQIREIDRIADQLIEPLVDHFADAAVVQDAVLMAFDELCQNAMEHGTSPSGCVVAMARSAIDGVGKISMSIGDLGIGIPDHIRRTQPGIVLDHHAIGRALEEG